VWCSNDYLGMKKKKIIFIAYLFFTEYTLTKYRFFY
jgi:hypothetical protein